MAQIERFAHENTAEPGYLLARPVHPRRSAHPEKRAARSLFLLSVAAADECSDGAYQLINALIQLATTFAGFFAVPDLRVYENADFFGQVGVQLLQPGDARGEGSFWGIFLYPAEWFPVFIIMLS